MQQNDEIISGWLNGSDSVNGAENPAGSLYTDGMAKTEAALTDPSSKKNLLCSILTKTTKLC